jgi:hypothetical protein
MSNVDVTNLITNLLFEGIDGDDFVFIGDYSYLYQLFKSDAHPDLQNVLQNSIYTNDQFHLRSIFDILDIISQEPPETRVEVSCTITLPGGTIVPCE